MSSGSWGDFADDPRCVYVDIPSNPVWVSCLDLLLSGGTAVGAYFGAKYWGASGNIALLIAVIATGLVGTKLSFFFLFRRIPQLSVEEFDAIRAAGSLALAAFRGVHPELPQVNWSLVAETDEARVISVSGSLRMQAISAEKLYAVPRDGALMRELSPGQYRRSSYSQGIERPDR